MDWCLVTEHYAALVYLTYLNLLYKLDLEATLDTFPHLNVEVSAKNQENMCRGRFGDFLAMTFKFSWMYGRSNMPLDHSRFPFIHQ